MTSENTHTKPTANLAQEKLARGSVKTPFAETLTHWQCYEDTQGFHWWLLDKADASTNTLSQAVLQELEVLVERSEKLSKSERPKAIIIRSLKSNGFIAGAEISEFKEIFEQRESGNEANAQDDKQLEQAVAAKIQEGLDIFKRLESLPIVTIALIHGFCLGGGLELALACRYRIARNDAKLGFPEVKLGLHPGLGGSVRLTRLISPSAALNAILSGKSIHARKAKSLGLVDALGEERHFENAVKRISGKKPDNRHFQWMNLLPARKVIARISQKKTAEKVKENHYPSPFKMIEVWRDHGGDKKAMYKAERDSFAKLVCSDSAQNLIRVFFLRENLRASGKEVPASIQHVHVIGAGLMGGDIAAWCAQQGLRVSLEDREAKLLAPAVKRANKLFRKKNHSPQAERDARDRLIMDLRGAGRKRADLIIEAIPEKLDIKRDLLQELSAQVKDSAIIATNTSSILLEDLRDSLQRPERFLGIHFFNPVSKMMLVEIVRHDKLSDDVLKQALAFAQTIDRLPVKVASEPGFLINRILTPYLLEALALLDDGFNKEEIDHAAEDFGMAMGPVELADHIGLDVCLHVAENLHENIKTQKLYSVPDWFRKKVEKENLGKKSGQGFYTYEDGKAIKAERDFDKANYDIKNRLVMSLLNTCVQCRGEGIVDSDDELDAAMVFGSGFAPFRGGPLHYAKELGIHKVVSMLRDLSNANGERFMPSEAWSQYGDTTLFGHGKEAAQATHPADSAQTDSSESSTGEASAPSLKQEDKTLDDDKEQGDTSEQSEKKRKAQKSEEEEHAL